MGSEKDCPIITGYAKEQPAGVEEGSARLQEASSLDRLRVAKSGWCWDQQSKLWHVKLDFSEAANVETRSYTA